MQNPFPYSEEKILSINASGQPLVGVFSYESAVTVPSFVRNAVPPFRIRAMEALKKWLNLNLYGF